MLLIPFKQIGTLGWGPLVQVDCDVANVPLCWSAVSTCHLYRSDMLVSPGSRGTGTLSDTYCGTRRHPRQTQKFQGLVFLMYCLPLSTIVNLLADNLAGSAVDTVKVLTDILLLHLCELK